MIALIKRFFDWYWSAADRERDAYFSRAVDLPDLEERIRNWERRVHP